MRERAIKWMWRCEMEGNKRAKWYEKKVNFDNLRHAMEIKKEEIYDCEVFFMNYLNWNMMKNCCKILKIIWNLRKIL